MKRFAVYSLFLLFSLAASAQTTSDVFKGYLFNDKYDVYIWMDFYNNNVRVPFQDIFGDLPGYFGDKHDGRKWLFVNAEIKDQRHAALQIVNDYGSEDLEATLEQVDDSTYVLNQGEGSTMKIARNRKWVKMPKKLEFKRLHK